MSMMLAPLRRAFSTMESRLPPSVSPQRWRQPTDVWLALPPDTSMLTRLEQLCASTWASSPGSFRDALNNLLPPELKAASRSTPNYPLWRRPVGKTTYALLLVVSVD